METRKEGRKVRRKEGRKTSWLDYILLRKSFVKYVIEGKIEGKRRRGLRRKQLLDDFNTLWTGDEDFRF
jgi:hypothetical protein